MTSRRTFLNLLVGLPAALVALGKPKPDAGVLKMQEIQRMMDVLFADAPRNYTLLCSPNMADKLKKASARMKYYESRRAARIARLEKRELVVNCPHLGL